MTVKHDLAQPADRDAKLTGDCGMTLREYYVGCALTGLCQGAYVMHGAGILAMAIDNDRHAALTTPQIIAELAHELAEGVIDERDERQRLRGGEKEI